MSHGESENNQHAAKTLTSSGHEHDRDFLQDFWQATVDLHSYLSKAQAHQQHDVNVPTDALQTLLNGVETIRRIQNLQEKRSVASLYIGTILGALIGVVGNFFVSFWFLTQSWWNTLGLTVSFVLLLFVCIALFLQAKKYAE